MRSSLESLGRDFEVVDVPSGEEAALEWARGRVDLLIADVRLPGISGLELMKKFRGRNPELKVILVSGVTDAKIRHEVAQAGADAFFFKPVDLADFLDAVERALGFVKSRLPSELQLAREGRAEGEKSQSLAERLTQLRQELGASAALLISDMGKVLARAGELPNAAMEPKMMPHLVAALHASAHLSNALERDTPEGLHLFRGKDHDLILTSVGGMYALLAARARLPMGDAVKAAEVMHAAAQDLLNTLARLGISTDTGELRGPATETAAEAGMDPKLESLVSQAKGKKSRKEEVDAFWETLIKQDESAPAGSGDSLSYEQAAQLGLAPEE